MFSMERCIGLDTIHERSQQNNFESFYCFVRYKPHHFLKPHFHDFSFVLSQEV